MKVVVLRVLLVVFLVGVSSLNLLADDTSVQQDNCELLEFNFLGEGPGTYTLPDGHHSLFVKRWGPFRIEQISGNTYTAKQRPPGAPERVWSLINGPGKLYRAFDGEIVIPNGSNFAPGETIVFPVLDDDVDFRNGEMRNGSGGEALPGLSYSNIMTLTDIVTFTNLTTITIDTLVYYHADSVSMAFPCKVDIPEVINTPTPTHIPTSTNTPVISTPTSTPTSIPTNTQIPPTLTPTSTPSNTPVIPTATSTSVPTITPTMPLATVQATPTQETPIATATSTEIPTSTSTSTPTRVIEETVTPIPTETSTPLPTSTVVCPPEYIIINGICHGPTNTSPEEFEEIFNRAYPFKLRIPIVSKR